MTHTYDAIVLGAGGFGSAALFHLARRGLKVLGIEQFGLVHDCGSSHGETRIIRKAYFEHPDYVPLLVRAYELWHELEEASGQALYTESGLILAGPPGGETIAGALESARLHQLRIEKFTFADAQRAFPQFTFFREDAVILEPEAGFLRVEACVGAHLELARRHGASLHSGETVRSWSIHRGSVRVCTDQAEYQAGRLVIAAGAWSGAVAADLKLPLVVRRKVMFWHPTSTHEWRNATAYYFERPDGCFYGFPSIDGATIKVAEHSGGEPIHDPFTVDRECHDDDRNSVSRFVTQCLRDVSPASVRHAVCMYTMTPDGHFIVDGHPEFPEVIFAAGFSGHGFKFTTVIGEALADLVTDGKTPLPLGFLRLDRPSLKT